MTPVALVKKKLEDISLPSLTRPAIGPKEEPTEELVLWGINYYVYSVLAHLRSISSALVQLAETGNIPAAYVLCRHVFEWTAHACYMNRNLKNYVTRKEWKRAWSLQSIVATGSLWVKKHGPKYDPMATMGGVPDPLTVPNLIKAYGEYLRQQGRGDDEANDSYGILSEHSHPNSACFLPYHRYAGREIHFVVPEKGSPLPIVNWCLLDTMMFLQELLGLSHEKVVSAEVTRTLLELAELAPKGAKS